MAISHSSNVTEYLKEQNINFVLKNGNVPNVPQVEGIETFWALCKSEYAKLKTVQKTIIGFWRVWTRISTEVAKTSEKAVMQKNLRNLRPIGWGGVKSL